MPTLISVQDGPTTTYFNPAWFASIRVDRDAEGRVLGVSLHLPTGGEQHLAPPQADEFVRKLRNPYAGISGVVIL